MVTIVTTIAIVCSTAASGISSASALTPAERAKQSASAEAAPQQAALPDSSPPSEIEEAVTEYACRQGRPRIKPYTEGWDACVSAHLESLRTAFGTNLKRMTEAERRTVDSACYGIRSDRDAYLQCLTGQLTALSDRKSRGKGTPTPASASAAAIRPATSPPSISSSASVPVPGSASPAQAPGRSDHAWPWIAGAVAAIVAAAAGGMPILMKARRAPRRCQACGSVEEPGLSSTGGFSAAPTHRWRAWIPVGGAPSGLCQKCRREAADAVRKAAQAREERRLAEERADEEARRQQREFHVVLFERSGISNQRSANSDQRSAVSSQLAVTSPASAPAEQGPEATSTQILAQTAGAPDLPTASHDDLTPPEDASPAAVLGVKSDASQHEILAAYQAAKAKYDPSLVDGLGDEVRAHFTAKRETIERAYQALSAKR